MRCFSLFQYSNHSPILLHSLKKNYQNVETYIAIQFNTVDIFKRERPYLCKLIQLHSVQRKIPANTNSVKEYHYDVLLIFNPLYLLWMHVCVCEGLLLKMEISGKDGLLLQLLLLSSYHAARVLFINYYASTLFDIAPPPKKKKKRSPD